MAKQKTDNPLTISPEKAADLLGIASGGHLTTTMQERASGKMDAILKRG